LLILSCAFPVALGSLGAIRDSERFRTFFNPAPPAVDTPDFHPIFKASYAGSPDG